MSASVLRIGPAAKFGPYAVHVASGPLATSLEAGERLGGPVHRRRGRVLLKLCVISLLVLAGGWASFSHQAALLAWASALPSLLQPSPPRPVASTLPLPAEEPLVPPLATSEVPASTPTPGSIAVPQPLAPGPGTEPSTEDAATPREPLPPAIADPADPLQVRALAAGLHPGLSRALLARLSPADFRNAATATRTALAETPDTEVFSYPRKRAAELALFQVKFVPGAAVGCRRYVVMVTKDGWLTTAMPMEKCGTGAKQARKGP